MAIDNYKPNTQPINSSTPFVCSHTVLHIRIGAKIWDTLYVSLHCHPSAATEEDFNAKPQTGNADYSLWETRTSFGKYYQFFLFDLS